MSEREDGSIEAESPSLVQPVAGGRPAWMVVLVALMFLFGARLFFTSLSTFQSLSASSAARSATIAVSAGTDQALARDLALLSRSFDQAHPTAVRVHALCKVALALVLFFAVAAVLTRDRSARLAALVSAGLSIVYHVGNAVFLILVVKPGVMAAAPLLAELASQVGGGATSIPDIHSFAATLVVVPILTALGGVGFSVVLLVYFGGHRGRLAYGVERPADHGG